MKGEIHDLNGGRKGRCKQMQVDVRYRIILRYIFSCVHIPLPFNGKVSQAKKRHVEVLRIECPKWFHLAMQCHCASAPLESSDTFCVHYFFRCDDISRMIFFVPCFKHTKKSSVSTQNESFSGVMQPLARFGQVSLLDLIFPIQKENDGAKIT